LNVSVSETVAVAPLVTVVSRVPVLAVLSDCTVPVIVAPVSVIDSVLLVTVDVVL
jgi:hypothetical protein